MARETKLGLGLVLILLTVFGFLVYKRAVNPLVTEGDPSEMAQADQNDTESPTSENQEAPTAETIVRTSGETTGGVLARPETSSDPFANPSQFEPSAKPVERTAVKTVATGTRPALPTAIDGDPFSSQDDGAIPGKATVAMDQFSSQDGGGDPFSDSPSTEKPASVAASEQAPVDGDPFGGNSTAAASPSASAGKSLPALPTNADDPFGGEAEPVETAATAMKTSGSAETSNPFTAEPTVRKEPAPAAAVALPVLGNLGSDDSRPATKAPELTGIESQEPDFGTDTAAMPEREPVREANADPFSSGPAMSFQAAEDRPEPRTFPAAKSAQPVELLPAENAEPTTIAERESDADPFGASSEEAPRLEPVPETRSIPVDPFPAEEIPTNRPVIAEQPKIAAPTAMENDPFGRPTPSETEPPARTPAMVDSSPDGFESPAEVASPTFEPANRTAPSTTLLPGIGVGAANADVRQPQSDDYQIQEGDSFWSVSRSIYGTGRYWKALQAFNADRVPDPNRMKLGTRLATPPTDVLERMHANLIPRAAIPEVAIQPSSGVTNLGGEQPGFFIGDQGVPMYRVGSEDTLSTIAERHLGRSSRWIQVFEMNRDTLKNGNDLKIGAVLRLPADASQVQLVSDR